MKNYTDKNVYLQEVVIPYLSGAKDRPISSICYDLDGNIIFASNVFARSFGYQSNEEIISKNICPQLNIAGSNTKLLIKTIIASKYVEAVSTPFIEPRIIEIDSNMGLTL